MLAVNLVGVDEKGNGGYRGSGASATEIRNKAKDAILSLLPYRIGYQHYLAEGVHEGTLRDLYRELRLDVPPDTRGQEYGSLGQSEVSGAAREFTHEGLNGATVEEDVKNSTSGEPLDNAKTVVSETPVATTKAPSSGPAQTAERNPPRTAIPQSQSSRPTAIAGPNRVNKPGLNGSLSDPRKSKASEAQIERKELIRQKLAAKRAVILPNSTRTRDPPPEAASENAKITVATDTGLTKPLSPTSEREKGNPSSLTPSSNQLALELAKDNQPSSLGLKPLEASKDITAPLPVETAISNAGRQTVLSPRSEEMDASKQVNSAEVGPKTSPEGKTNHMESFSSPQGVVKATTSIQPSSPATEAVNTRQDVGDTSGSVPGIPGLFMISSKPQEENTKPTTPASPSAPPPTRMAPRKRPVAADFDTDPPPTAASFKRPFGHSRFEQPLVINVSEDESADEDEDSRMDVDVDQSVTRASQSSQAQCAPEQQKRMSIRDMPPLTDLPATRRGRLRTNGFGRTSTPGTPSIDSNGGKGKNAAQEDLKRTEEKIQLMQKKIAELELRKALANKSRTSTPVKPNSLPPPSKPMVSTTARDPSAQAVSDKMSLEKSQQMEENAKALAAAKAAEAEERRKLIQARIEERNRRRAQIESDLSQTRAEAEKGQQRLEELREEEERCQTTLQEALSKKLRLEEELQKLELEDKSSPDEVQQKNVMPEDAAVVSSSDQTESVPLREQSTGLATTVSEMSVEHVAGPAITPSLQACSQVDESVESSSQSTAEPLQIHTNHHKSGAALHIAGAPSSATSDRSSQISLGRPYPSELPESFNTAEKAGSDVDTTEPPAPSEPISLNNDRPVDPKGGLNHPSEVAEDASISPKEGETEQDLSAALCNPLPNGAGPAEKDTTTSSTQISEDSDSYEPPEQLPSDFLNQQTMNSPPFSPAASQTASSYSPTLEGPSPVVPHESPVLTSPALAASNMLIPAHETNQAPMANTNTDESSQHSRTSPSGYFKPYVSPLRQFRSYRYHPEYLQEVSEGFRSLTFSHKIDPNQPVCTYETSGGICNDDSCGGQHFRDMGLSDDRILGQIVSVREGNTPQEESQYMDGLRQALKELRVNKVKDISTVATKIAAYRSSFLKDPSRVLILNAQRPKSGQ